MPIYEYRCKECHQLFEEWSKHIEDDGVQHSCPICKGAAVRLMSNTSFALKGSGWYVTEYGSRSNNRESAAPKADSAAPSPCSSGACPSGQCSADKTPSTPTVS